MVITCYPVCCAPMPANSLPNPASPTRTFSLQKWKARIPKHYSAEFDPYFEKLIAHPQLLEMARSVLGSNIRLDHCVTLNRRGGYPGSGWHSHAYADDDPKLGLVRIFFYVNGFEAYDGALKVVPGSHLFRDSTIEADGASSCSQHRTVLIAMVGQSQRNAVFQLIRW